MLIIPFIGLLIYLMLRPSQAQVAKRARRRAGRRQAPPWASRRSSSRSESTRWSRCG